MVVPVALAQLVARSFAQTVVIACLTGLAASLLGTTLSFYANTPSGGTIVLLVVAAFAVTAVVTLGVGRLRALRHRRRHDSLEQHGDHVHHGDHIHGEPGCDHPVLAHENHVDYVHDGHRHAPRLTQDDAGYDEH